MTKPTDLEALEILTEHLKRLAIAPGPPKYRDFATDALWRAGITCNASISPPPTRPIREVEMLTKQELGECMLDESNEHMFVERIERACAAKWGLKIKEDGK